MVWFDLDLSTIEPDHPARAAQVEVHEIFAGFDVDGAHAVLACGARQRGRKRLGGRLFPQARREPARDGARHYRGADRSAFAIAADPGQAFARAQRREVRPAARAPEHGDGLPGSTIEMLSADDLLRRIPRALRMSSPV